MSYQKRKMAKNYLLEYIYPLKRQFSFLFLLENPNLNPLLLLLPRTRPESPFNDDDDVYVLRIYMSNLLPFPHLSPST